jgi:hypothetical protein
MARAIPGTIPPTEFGAIFNMDGASSGHYSKLSGWTQYGAGFPCFLNQDLHDQMSRAINGTGLRDGTCIDPTLEPVTYISSISSSAGRRRLIAGTKTALYAGDDLDGSWRFLGYGYGGSCPVVEGQSPCSDTRFQSATVGNYTLFSNGVDDVLSWLFDSEPTDGDISLKAVGDLVGLGIGAARHIMAFGGYVLIADFVEEGFRQSSTILWSDYNNPLSYIPGGESLAGRFDFGRGEKFLAMKPMGGGFRVYTSLAVYHVTAVADSRVFAFDELCRNMQPVTYPNTLISTGNEHIWVGNDSIYIMAEFDRTPRRVGWLHEASGVIHRGVSSATVGGLPPGFPSLGFPSINKSLCLQAIAAWDYSNECMWISWPTGTNTCPDKSLVLWPRTQKASVVDHGFTAFTVHQPYLRKSLRTVMDDFRVCSKNARLAPLESVGCSSGNEVIAYPSLYNATKSSAQPMDQDSAIAAFCGFCFDTLCATCDSSMVWVMASAADFTLKQLDPGNCVREELTGITDVVFPEVTTGCYAEYGYTWLIQGGPQRMGDTGEQTIKSITVGFVAPEDIPYGYMHGQAGSGDQPGRIDWDSDDPVTLGPQDGGPASTVDWSRSGDEPTFVFMTTGSWLNWRIFGDGLGGCVQVGEVVINGGSC